MKHKFLTIGVAAVGALFATFGEARADWPEKPIKITVPFKAGGTSDQIARNFQAAIQEEGLLDKPLTIINVGGHYSIGARQGKDAAPDGYNFFLMHIAMMGGEATGAMDFGWRDFEPVIGTGSFCNLPVVRKDSGYDSISDLLAAAKAAPDSLIFGANLNAINHMAGVMMEGLEEGAKFRYVQTGGGPPNFAALTGGQINASVMSGAEVMKFAYLPDGSENPDSAIKALAYGGSERNAALPDLPTFKELGYDFDFCVTSWWFAPKGTPQEAIDGMADALEAAAATGRVQEFWRTKVFEPKIVRGEALTTDLEETWDRIQPIALQTMKK
ncbi:Tripartite tricarboxylate transporter family receptor [Marinovum algicola]|uniref:Tripartite-type tricarboxylate transporter, receptor component TctC n=1 Tax=Marinovum algicola TaxID=42444 RepID=A0A975ZR44_9RHOB|nr:tripartite tricarboxylate transporter substrate binding protein [Marinovum algicola]SEK11146.1 Tripartite-type tricarboxylate transporter, receptor component TctC [Marinovum algicola]SLN71233.1 Tripartite tricarboxylate transporter family receptor [Marinovum algicola]